ncbi:hypothetical protein AJ80_06452 [Polytolypa hystricis UAMH7299]|uniref:Uncharacterized protein n=1 Tax=Polytolypa hystricis (strain UAMH7299) TaxID=1447883 RepID=A0A2B7XVP2_POLH7|nr:hypothetical protein AJ80_06452 [Polytolypa hystricis UAMH7299]
MHLRTIFTLISLSSLALASPFPEPDAGVENANCGYPNGNCYDNGCNGERSRDRVTCTLVRVAP